MHNTGNQNLTAFSVNSDDGRKLNIYIEPIHHHDDSINVYALYQADSETDSIFNHLSMPAEIGENIPGLDDINKKAYLGEINLTNSPAGWEYEGDKLSEAEQQQVAAHLKTTLFN